MEKKSLEFLSIYKESLLEALKLYPKMFVRALVFFLPYVLIRLSFFYQGPPFMVLDSLKTLFLVYYSFFVFSACASYLAEKDISFKEIFTLRFNRKFLRNFCSQTLAVIVFIAVIGLLVGAGFLMFSGLTVLSKAVGTGGLGSVINLLLFLVIFVLGVPFGLLVIGLLLLFSISLSFITNSIICNNLRFSKVFTYSYSLIKGYFLKLAGISFINIIMLAIIYLPVIRANVIPGQRVSYLEFIPWLKGFSLEVFTGLFISLFFGFVCLKLFLKLEDIKGFDSPLFTGEAVPFEEEGTREDLE